MGRASKTFTTHLDFNDAWLQQSVGNINRLIQTFKQRLKDIYIQTWHTQIESSTRANSYKLFCDFNFKPYLNCVTVKKYRFAFSRLRVSSHRLAIESGRWHKANIIPLNERKCQYCNKLEDEFHFVLECPLYNDFRKNLIKRYYWNNPNILKFVSLLTTENKKETKNFRKMYIIVIC